MGESSIPIQHVELRMLGYVRRQRFQDAGDGCGHGDAAIADVGRDWLVWSLF